MSSLNGYDYVWAPASSLPGNQFVLVPTRPSYAGLLMPPPPQPAATSSLFGWGAPPATQMGTVYHELSRDLGPFSGSTTAPVVPSQHAQPGAHYGLPAQSIQSTSTTSLFGSIQPVQPAQIGRLLGQPAVNGLQPPPLKGLLPRGEKRGRDTEDEERKTKEMKLYDTQRFDSPSW